METEAKEPAVGIDLGTTYSRVGWWKNGRVEIIANEQGNRATPSCVAFTDKEWLIGERALNQAATNPANTIFDAKRWIGSRLSEERVQNDLKLWPFKVIASEAGKPLVVVSYMGKEKQLSAEEISSMILLKMKDMASAFVGRPVKKAVVTVPAYFNNAQRQATRDAGAIAGLEIIHVLNEPTAAALEYALDNKDRYCGDDRQRWVLVFDLGGGTLDVSVLRLDRHGELEVKATCGNTHLGGQDFDNRMVEHLLEFFQKKHGEDVSKNHMCVRRLKAACERAKRTLSTEFLATIEIEAFHNGKDFYAVFSREWFECINRDLFKSCLEPVRQCLRDAGVNKKDIDEVLPVGGSTRIPKVQDMLRAFFHGKARYKSIDVDEAVAYGAALRAAILNGDRKDPGACKLGLVEVYRTIGDYQTAMRTVHQNIFGSPPEYPVPLQSPFPAPFSHQTVPKLEAMSSLTSSQWEKGELIGSGTFGKVYMATNRFDGSICAMKEVNLIPDDPKYAECIKQLQQEIKFLSQLKHPNIVQYYGSDIIGDQFYIYLEHVYPGPLHKYVQKRGRLKEVVVRNFTRHILEGLAYLHGEKVMHRDIKGANLLVDAAGVVKLADFGMAKCLGEVQGVMSLKGTPYWMAPEVLQASMNKEKGYDLAIDIWSLGCTVIEMFAGKHPWNGLETAAALFKVLKSPPKIPEDLSPEGKDFLQQCFRRNPAERPSANELLKHTFLHTANGFHQPSAGMRISVHQRRLEASSSLESERTSLKSSCPLFLVVLPYVPLFAIFLALVLKSGLLL